MCALVAANGLLSPGFPLAAEFPFSLFLVLATLASDPGHRVLTQTYFFSAFDGNLNKHLFSPFLSLLTASVLSV